MAVVALGGMKTILYCLLMATSVVAAESDRHEQSAASRPAETTRPATNPAKRVVFLIDTSGSMLLRLPEVREEVGKALTALRADQEFCLIGAGESVAALDAATLPTTPVNMARAAGWLNGLQAVGEADAVAGLRAALGMHPDVIWFVTDGDLADHAAVLKYLRQQNRDRVRINTTLRFATGAEDDSTRFLWQLARESGGVCVDAGGKPLPAGGPDKPIATPDPATLPTGPSIFR